jgi:hypothetical protein
MELNLAVLHTPYLATSVCSTGNLAIREDLSPSPAVAAGSATSIGRLPWQRNPGRLHMAMKGFFDESGTHDSPVVIVGGFLATVEQWDAYERDLRDLFAEYGVGKFHAKDFRGRKGDFKGWTRPKLARFNSRFLQLADEHLACGISAVLPTESYKRIYRADGVVRTGRLSSQYGLAVRVALWKSILSMKERKADWPLNFVFETGTHHEMEAANIFFEVRDGLQPEYTNAFGSVTFETKTTLPLAIADSLSYAIFRLSAGHSRHPTEPNAAVVGPADPPYLVHKIPMSRTLVDENSLKGLRDALCQ